MGNHYAKYLANVHVKIADWLSVVLSPGTQSIVNGLKPVIGHTMSSISPPHAVD